MQNASFSRGREEYTSPFSELILVLTEGNFCGTTTIEGGKHENFGDETDFDWSANG